jgi:hypothetical protein
MKYQLLFSVACAQIGFPGVSVPAIFSDVKLDNGVAVTGDTTTAPIPATEQPIEEAPAPPVTGTPAKTDVPANPVPVPVPAPEEQIVPAVDQPIGGTITPEVEQPIGGGEPPVVPPVEQTTTTAEPAKTQPVVTSTAAEPAATQPAITSTAVETTAEPTKTVAADPAKNAATPEKTIEPVQTTAPPIQTEGGKIVQITTTTAAAPSQTAAPRRMPKCVVKITTSKLVTN